jgi:hypothetical protein
MDLRRAFATNLRRLHHAKGLSQQALAHEAAVDRSYQSQSPYLFRRKCVFMALLGGAIKVSGNHG